MTRIYRESSGNAPAVRNGGRTIKSSFILQAIGVCYRPFARPVTRKNINTKSERRNYVKWRLKANELNAGRIKKYE